MVLGVGQIIVIVSGDLLLDVEIVVEGREGGGSWAGCGGPVPGVSNGLGETANDGDALMGESLGVSVLMAHHDEGLTVDCESLLELGVAVLDVVHGTTESVELVSVP